MKRFKYLTLAALVAFAACDEGEETITPPPVTGSISGVVQIEGAGVAGISVSLSSGATATTDASGAFTFSGVAAGAYTVSIAGFPADATFSSTAQAATITSAGQVVSLNFSGTYVRTSAIIGSVAAGGLGIPNVAVSIGSSETMTDDNGQFAFRGLRAGAYTVDISGFDPSMYSFANTSSEVTVGVGESKVVAFSGTLVATATVGGYLFVDENDRNEQYDGPLLEDFLADAGVAVGIEITIGDTIWTETDENGYYEFMDLEAGTYKVIIDADDSDIPSNYMYSGTAGHAMVITVTTGAEGMVHFPFWIIVQRVEAAAFLGTDIDVSASPGPGQAPLDGVVIDLYDTEANASIGGATGRLDQATTGADGTVTFEYDRADDDSPGGGADNIVFVRFNSITSANKTLNGETIIETRFESRNASVVAPDTLDFLNTGIILKFNAEEVAGGALAGWNAALWRNSTTAPSIQGTNTDSNGMGRFVESTGTASLPDTFYIRLGTTQAGANGHGFNQTPVPDMGAADGIYLQYVHTGANQDSVMLGTELVDWADADIQVRAHNETDDSTDVPTFTGGDAVAANMIDVELWQVDPSDGSLSSFAGPFALAPGSGELTFGISGLGGAVPTGFDYYVEASSRAANQDVLNDTLALISLDGGKQADTANALTGGAGYSSFAWKYNDNSLSGVVRALDGTDADGLPVTIMPSADNIQSNLVDTTLTVTGGAWNLTGLREGPYDVMVSSGDSAAAWQFFVTVTGNEDATMGIRDMDGPADGDIVNFTATRMDTKFQGTVINDRDNDGNVIDPDEALAGAEIELYRDGSGAITLDPDSMVGTATTGSNGEFSFEGLREGRYVAAWVAGTPNLTQDVYRSLTTDTVVGTTAATTTGLGANNTRQVGTTTPAVLPRWNYNTSMVDGGWLPTNMTFLFKNTVVSGTALNGATAVPGMTVSMRRCNVSAGALSPPTPGGVCTTYLGTTINVVTDANGDFILTGLVEGVYEVRPQPTTVAGFTSSVPATALYITVGNGDVEDATFQIS